MNVRALALDIRDLLTTSGKRLVCVESCTGGSIASALTCIPGASRWFCGSLVVYRTESKSQWLGVDREMLQSTDFGPVSQMASNSLALAALSHTSEADFAFAITGDIGPGAPDATDGICFAAFTSNRSPAVQEKQFQLASPEPEHGEDVDGRQRRIAEAVGLSLVWLQDLLKFDQA